MQAFLKPLSEVERQAQLLRFAIETQQHAEELRAKRKRAEDKKKRPGRPKKQQRADEKLMAAAASLQTIAAAAESTHQKHIVKRIHWFVKHPDLVRVICQKEMDGGRTFCAKATMSLLQCVV